MAIFSTSGINFDNVKVRWQEPYVSNALNRKVFGVLPKGIYEGFVIGPGGLSNRDIIVNTGSVSGGLGTGMIGNYVSGNFDEATNFSIAVHQNTQGWQTTVTMPPGTMPIHLDATGTNGTRVYMVIDVTYSINQATTANFLLVDGTQINSNPSYIVIGYCDVPGNPSTPLDSSMFGYNDPTFPRLTPLSTPSKAGFMPASAWATIAQNNPFIFQNLLVSSVDTNNAHVIDVSPSQQVDVNNKRIYTYIQANIASKFPRNSSGLYNGGVGNNAATTFNFQTGVIGGAHQISGNTSFATPSVSGTANGFQTAIIALDSGDNLSLTYGSIFTSSANALLDDNLPVVGTALFQICLVLITTDGSGVVQPFGGTSIFDRRPFLNLGGSGSGTGGASVSPASGYMAIVTDTFGLTKSQDPNINTTFSNAVNNAAKDIYAMSCDKSKTFTTTGTSYTISGTPSYTVAVGDIIYSGGNFRRIATVTNQTTGTLDVGFPSNLVSAAGMVSQAFWTNDLVNVGDATQLTRPRDFFPSQNILQINLDYHDSLAAGDNVPDYVSTANLVAAATNSGLQTDVSFPTTDTFAPIYTRPTAVYPNNQVADYPLLTNTNQQRLVLVFFPNPSNGSVTTLANLCNFSVSFYAQSVISNGGYLNSAFCFSDSSGTPVNCSNPTVLSNVTVLTLNFNYVPGLNVGTTAGDLEIIVDGEVLPRFVAGTTLDAYYIETPLTTNQITFWANLSTYQRSIEVRRRQGSVDSSSQNTSQLSAINDILVGTSGQVAAGIAQYSSLQTALGTLSTGGKIFLVGNPTAENISISLPNIFIEGKGRETQITGTLTFVSGADYGLVRALRITDNVTMNSNKTYLREIWLAPGKAVSIGGSTSGNDAEYMPE